MIPRRSAGEFITGLPGDEMADCMATYVVDTAAGQFKRISFVWRPRVSGTQMDAASVAVVEKQLRMYNARDVDGFMNTIADDVQVCTCMRACMVWPSTKDA